MAMERINDIHGRRCPACTAHLTALAARHNALGRTDPVYLQDDAALECPNGHALPSPAELYIWRDAHGYSADE